MLAGPLGDSPRECSPCEILLPVITEAAIRYEWRGAAEEIELDWLHAEAFDHPPSPSNWQRQLEHHSLGWVCARLEEELVGFANVLWDGGSHAVLLNTMVLPSEQRQGIGSELVRVAAEEAKRSGAEWLHADFDRSVATFYLEECGFVPTEAGLLDLKAIEIEEAEPEEVEGTDPQPAPGPEGEASQTADEGHFSEGGHFNEGAHLDPAS